MQANYTLADLSLVLQEFGCQELPTTASRWGDGHIHQSFKLGFGKQAGKQRPALLLQALNLEVFPDPERLMQNVIRVTEYGRAKLRARGQSLVERRMLTALACRDAGWLVRKHERVWRCYLFIEGTRSLDVLADEGQAQQVARAYGGFIELFADLDPAELHLTLPDFHNTPKRLEALRRAAGNDPVGRRQQVGPELDFVEQREATLAFVEQGLASGALQRRITHNDTKLNNVLLDAESGEGLCVIDLDTVMPGCTLHDFGDMLRSCLSASREDEVELRRIHARADVFRGLVTGFVEALGPLLSDLERQSLFQSGLLITLEIGMRFLTDHLEGDVYYPIQRPNHNLDRARAQFALLCSMEAQAGAFQRIAERAPRPRA